MFGINVLAAGVYDFLGAFRPPARLRTGLKRGQGRAGICCAGVVVAVASSAHAGLQIVQAEERLPVAAAEQRPV
jgi:hypothetical protein